MTVTERLTAAMRTALTAAGLPDVDDCVWDIPRQSEHGDYATNVAMVLAKPARRAPRQIADAIVKNFPKLDEVARLEVAGPGFLNIFLSPAWTAGALHEILEAGPRYGPGTTHAGQRIRLEFVSANPTGPLVIVNARAAAVGDALARMLRAQAAAVTTE
jgi:arginyl-tRNA synthetase